MPMRRTPALLLVLALLGAATVRADEPALETIHFGIEIQDVLCGYSVLQVSDGEDDGLLHVDQHVFAMISALGSKFNTDLRFTYEVERHTGAVVAHTSRIEQGRMQMSSSVRIEDGVAVCTSSLEEEEKRIDLADDVVRENPLFYPHLLHDFRDGKVEEKTYPIFEFAAHEVQESTYTRKGTETLTLAGTTYADALVLERRNLATGVTLTLWLDTESGRLVKAHIGSDRKVFRADASVTKRIELANLDASITTRTNVTIADIQGITYMKVRAVMEPTGLRLEREALVVPGQGFEGTVEGNRIEGVFEIQHPRYTGEEAPPFPPRFDASGPLGPYIAADAFVQADDPVLVAAAREITAGATNAWDASRRIARWVSENIDYAIPGGVTARKTYDTRTGECGSHSILYAAFCRALGIPARVVWGCMYVPNMGGAFGQHAWNEVYMGEAGWIPIDTTASEIDFVDSGHIRIGEMIGRSIAVNTIEMEVLDHRVEDAPPSEAAPTTQLEPYVGTYTHTEAGLVAKTKVQGRALVVEVVGRISFVLKAPDAEGRHYAKLSDRLYCTFERSDTGEVVELHVHELVRMQRTATPEVVPDSVPEALRGYLGSYLLAPVNATFEVVFVDGRLAVKDPLAKKTIGLQEPDAKGRFLDEFGKNTISFQTAPEGEVRALVLDTLARFRRSE